MKFLKLFPLLLLVLFGCSKKADNIKMTKIPVDIMGFSFEIPEEWNNSQDIIIVPVTKANGNSNFFEIAFYFMTDDAKNTRENLAKNNDLSIETLPQILEKSFNLAKFVIYENNSSTPEINKTEKWEELKKIGENDNFNIFFCKANNSNELAEQYKEKYNQYFSIFDKIKNSLETFDPKNPDQPQNTTNGLEGKIEFNANDLEGNAINSSELFKQNKLTMVNIWGTYCSPCIEEMPELIKLNTEYKDFAVVGIVIDGNNNEATVISMVEKLGINFTNIVPNSEINNKILQYVSAVPTTFFVNSEGLIVGEIIVGADIEGYKRNIENLLNQK